MTFWHAGRCERTCVRIAEKHNVRDTRLGMSVHTCEGTEDYESPNLEAEEWIRDHRRLRQPGDWGPNAFEEAGMCVNIIVVRSGPAAKVSCSTGREPSHAQSKEGVCIGQRSATRSTSGRT
jgi:hypothetical protein